ncbi:MAG: MATE family efflux transporter [Solobacterium sp.]|nr:MATE family efflux transporter [Solobacterium sp.]
MAWPAVLESFFVSLAGIIDTLMVSSMGTYAVASVGLTGQPKFVILAPFFACNIALSALVARRRGQQNRENANQLLITALTYTLIACIILSILAYIFAPNIISFSGSNIDTHDAAVTYFRVIHVGLFFNVFSLVINAAQRGSGNTRIAMTTNVTSSIVNVIFNYLLINGNFGFPKWGIFGAAFATVLGTVAAFILSIRSLFAKDSYVSLPYCLKQRIRPSFEALKNIYLLAYNFFIENVAMRIGFVVTAVLAAKLGTDAFAAHQVGMNFLGLGFSFGDGMQVAAVALIGRSLGEKKIKKAKEYGITCQHIGLAISLALALFLFLFGRTIFSFFFQDEHVLDMGVLVSRFIMVIVLFQISQVIYGGCLRAAGDVKYTLFASLISVTLIRSLVTYILVSLFHLGLVGVWIGVLSDQLSRFLFMSLRFKQGDWVHLQI